MPVNVYLEKSVLAKLDEAREEDGRGGRRRIGRFAFPGEGLGWRWMGGVAWGTIGPGISMPG